MSHPHELPRAALAVVAGALVIALNGCAATCGSRSAASAAGELLALDADGDGISAGSPPRSRCSFCSPARPRWR